VGSFALGRQSQLNLVGVHPAVVKVVLYAIQITPYDFGILRGVTTPEKQAKLVASGASLTLDSYHLPQPDGYGYAIDFGVYVDGQYINGDTPEEIGYYRKVMQSFVTAAIALGVQIELGGLWRTYVDAGHVQLNKDYPRD